MVDRKIDLRYIKPLFCSVPGPVMKNESSDRVGQLVRMSALHCAESVCYKVKRSPV